MTNLSHLSQPIGAAVLTPEEQSAVWFFRSLVRVRLGGFVTGGELAVLGQRGERGYGSPVHQHQADDEIFFVIDGELRVEVDGVARAEPNATTPPPGLAQPDVVALSALAKTYGIDIIGPTPRP